MNRTFNTQLVRATAEKAGHSFTSLADAIGVSVESVSKWMNGEAVPRPGKALKLGELLDLAYDQVITRQGSELEPLVSFRLTTGDRPSDEQRERGKRMGQLYEQLVPFLPFDKYEAPLQLKNVNSSYAYVNGLGSKLRSEMAVAPDSPLPIEALFRYLSERLQAVVVPVFWGHRTNEMELAAHIYSQRTHTTWIPLNLETKNWNAKFWVAHELAHALSFVELKDSEESEKFADALAGTLVFPEAIARATFDMVNSRTSKLEQFDALVEMSSRMDISPICVAKQVDRFARETGLAAEPFDGEDFRQFLAPLKEKEPTFASVLFRQDTPDVRTLREVTERVMHSPFFSALSSFLKERHGGVAYIQALLDCSLSDAMAINSELA